MTETGSIAQRKDGEIVRFRSTLGRRAVFRLAPFVLVGGSAVLPLASGTYRTASVVLLVAAIALPIWLVLGTSYRVRHDILVIRLPPRRREIPLATITGVRRITYADSWGMMPLDNDFTLGTDALEIRSDGHPSVYVSPHNEDAFLAAIGNPVVDDARRHWAS